MSLAPLEIANRVEIRESDVMKLIGDNANGNDTFAINATAVFVYLLPKGLKVIRPILEVTAQNRRKEGRAFRVVSYMFSVPGWNPTKIDRTTKGECPVYLYSLESIVAKDNINT